MRTVINTVTFIVIVALSVATIEAAEPSPASPRGWSGSDWTWGRALAADALPWSDREQAMHLAVLAMGGGMCVDDAACRSEARAALVTLWRHHDVGWWARRGALRVIDRQWAMERHDAAWRRVHGRATDCYGCKDGRSIRSSPGYHYHCDPGQHTDCVAHKPKAAGRR